ncbi:uncharacterized protein CPUR_08654 [Claviceps purpurea 20.1]|uniref:F-box domain-containing protein n=1 Tax=Claviceps purpurea (strain 20.1) TaxID=1111077 RepID=M1WGP0_CLAP2|nr:uncharacterized protein CPUR_08654 [Claviceps purpurea 20.1]
MDSATREARVMAWERNTEESTCPMVLLPPEMQKHILSFLSTQESLSRLGQSCRDWYEVANEELYKRDSRENSSFSIKWMAAHAVDGQTTDSALRTLEISRRWGGQIDAVKRLLSHSDRARLNEDQIMYETSTALHFSVFLGNMRLTETLLDMKASLAIPCLNLLRTSMSSEEVLRRVNYFQFVFSDIYFGPAFPIFLAFLKSDPHMCKLLVERGAGREAAIVYLFSNPKVMSILHFAAADPTADYRQWRCLFDGFREYIDELCPPESKYTPLHIALESGCIQGMQIAVEFGADKEARSSFLNTPLYIGIWRIPYHTTDYQKTFEKPISCLRKFVELGASVNPEEDSVLVLAVKIYAPNPVYLPNMRQLIYFLLDHHADVHGTSRRNNSNVVNEIVLASTSSHHKNPLARELLKELLSDLVDRGFNLRTPAPGFPSPLYYVLHDNKAKPKWLFDFLCENGATIHEREVDSAFLRWCEMFRWWRKNENSAWWKHQGQEDKVFLKWCEDPYNAWWWQHVKHISPHAVTLAYGEAFKRTRQLYNILTHLPLPAPLDGLLIGVAFEAEQLWSWRLVVHREFEDNLLATWSFDDGENMIHLTVRKYVAESCYTAADAVLDVLHLRDKGVNMSSPNSHGQTPLELLLRLGSCKSDFVELVTLLEGNMGVQGLKES